MTERDRRARRVARAGQHVQAVALRPMAPDNSAVTIFDSVNQNLSNGNVGAAAQEDMPDRA